MLIANPGSDLYGSDRMVLETVAALLAGGYRVVVTAPTDGPLLAEVVARGGEATVCPTVVMRKGLLNPGGLIQLGAEAVRSIRPSLALLRRVEPEVVYVNTITPPLWLLVARLTGRQAVCHVHEGESRLPPLLRRAINLPLLLADLLIVNSEFSLDVLTGALPVLGRKAHVVYNAVAGPPQVVPPRRTLDGVVRLLFVGRLSPRKGPDLAIEALRILRSRGVDAVLDLVGAVFPGNEWYERDLVEQIQASSLQDVVLRHGFKDDIWPLAAAADIALVPAVVDESFGNTAIEALLAARPLVVSGIGGLTEAVAGFTAAVVVPPADPGELADAVECIVSQWGTYRAAAIRDAETAAIRYSAQRYGERLLAVMEQVTRSGSRAGASRPGRRWNRPWGGARQATSHGFIS